MSAYFCFIDPMVLLLLTRYLYRMCHFPRVSTPRFLFQGGVSILLPFGKNGDRNPHVWARTSEIFFGNMEVTRHDFYGCFKHSDGIEPSAFDALSRLPGRAMCISHTGFKTVA